MPRFYYRRWNRRPWQRWRWRKRRITRLRRPRKTFRRRWRLRTNYFRVRKYKPKRKLRYLRLKEYQPQNIKKCKIKGMLQLFACGPNRLNKEFSSYLNSFFPEHNQGGGGWSAYKFTLESLYEQRELLRNYWTQSNVQLPLVRYCGCKFKFYRAEDIDYVCYYNVCLPMKVSVYDFTSAQPSNMLMKRKKIIVPSKRTNPHRKGYITKRIKCTELFQNKWYFQSDIYKTPFLILITTACSLDRMTLNPRSKSSNISLNALNLDIFKNHNFQNIPVGTQPWGPKAGYWLYGTLNADDNPQIKNLIFLGQTKTYQKGNTLGSSTNWTNYNNGKQENFGNVFHKDYITQTVGVFIATTPPNEQFWTHKEKRINDKDNTVQSFKITKLTQPLIVTIRYTPERDKGYKNKIYLVKDTDTTESWQEPEDETLIHTGYPLWCLLWGWTDWCTKIKSRLQVEDSTILVIETDTTWPKKEKLVLIDNTFIQGTSPWQTQTLYPVDSQMWHPVVKFQEAQIETICETGPFTAKTYNNSIEAHCEYRFYLKWGGCTTDVQHITDPGEQEHFPVPNYQLQGPEIQDPEQDPKNEIWNFDIRRHMLTARAAKRIKTDFSTPKITLTGSALSADIKQAPSSPQETPTPEEEETTPQQQLQLLRDHQRKLRKQLRKLLKTTPHFKYSDL
nr:MAG: ORF1 [TTV-like mini virus]